MYNRRLKRHFLSFLLALVCCPSCVSQLFLGKPEFDGRRITIQTLAMFNQREKAKTGPSWHGDWIFRRERLEAIDARLREAKPDVLILQEVLAKQGSPYDSDQYILGAGALQGYEWQLLQIRNFRDTHEVESISVVSGLPVQKDPYEDERKKMWIIGDESYLSAFVVQLEEENIAIFNLKIAEIAAAQGIWYDYIKARIVEFLKQYSICHKRIIVAGEFETSLTQSDYQRFLIDLELIDTSIGFCEKEELCNTATPLNPLFRLSIGDSLPKRSTRILSHRSALVYSSARNFDLPMKDSGFNKIYDTDPLAPVQKYGWKSSLRLARCRD